MSFNRQYMQVLWVKLDVSFFRINIMLNEWLPSNCRDFIIRFEYHRTSSRTTSNLVFCVYCIFGLLRFLMCMIMLNNHMLFLSVCQRDRLRHSSQRFRERYSSIMIDEDEAVDGVRYSIWQSMIRHQYKSWANISTNWSNYSYGRLFCNIKSRISFARSDTSIVLPYIQKNSVLLKWERDGVRWSWSVHWFRWILFFIRKQETKQVDI
jgi:hypothetical protein